MLLTFGLFETAADVCSTINALIKAGFKPASLSLIARDLESDTGEQNDRRTTIAQTIDALDLVTAGRHMLPSVLAVIPEEGTYLLSGRPARILIQPASVREQTQTQLCALLCGFGCAGEEAQFLDGRLQAGTMLLGVADTQEERLKAAREIFADQQAIHVGAAELSVPDDGPAPPADVPRPDSYTPGEVVVLDVAMLAVDRANERDSPHELIGHTLLDETGAEIGAITSVVVDPEQTAQSEPQYIIVQHGGFLGVGQHEYVIPIELLEPGTLADSYWARFNLQVLENAPAFDVAFPISRREEQSICGYYGLAPYWDGDARIWSAAERAAPIEGQSLSEPSRVDIG